MLVAIDRTSKFAFVELHERVTRKVAADFLQRLTEAVPYKVHTVLTDNGTHFTTPGNVCSAAKDIRVALDAGETVWAHAFELACARADVDHRLTKPFHPWTNGQVERMNRTIKDATVRAYHYESHEQLRDHLAAFVGAYNFARRLKALGGLTPFEAICKAWTKQPYRFRLSPDHLTSGLNIYCSTSVAGNPLTGDPASPRIVANYQQTFSRLKGLKADVFLGPHAEFFDLNGKRARMKAGGPNPFVDPGELQRFVKGSEAHFETELGAARQAP